MKNVLLVGGGKIGVAITEFLSQSGDYKVTAKVWFSDPKPQPR